MRALFEALVGGAGALGHAAEHADDQVGPVFLALLHDAEARQHIVIELYDKFFRTAFPRMAVNAMDLRLAVAVLPSMHPTLTLYFPGLGKFSQPIGNDW